MAYTQDLRNAAYRHCKAAQILYSQSRPADKPQCLAVAGYLFGLAGELAVKELMRKSGMIPKQGVDRRDDPFYAHFPTLKTMLAASVRGRLAGDLRKWAENPRLFQDWDIEMRYAPTTAIEFSRVQAWKESAEELLNNMETL